ncbi:MAG: T9SS type A sorting domain-containing protein [Ferruginibacter sp.]
MEKNFTQAGNTFKILTAVAVTVLLMLAVKKATAHTVVYYNPPCFTQGSTVTVGVKVIIAASGSYYHWQYRSTAGGSWTWLGNGNNTINGRVFSVANASLVSNVADYTPDLVISNVGSPAYTTELNNVELRVIMTNGLDPQYNPYPGTSAWGAEEWSNANQAKYIRLFAKPANENCYSNCSGNILVNDPASLAPALTEYYGGFEVGTGSTDLNFSTPGTYGATSKASTDITKWTGGTLGTSPRYRIMSNGDSMNTAFSAFAPHSGNQMMVVSNNNSAAARIWYRTTAVVNPGSFYGGQVTFKAWFAKLDASNASMVLEVKGASTQAGTVAAFANNTVTSTINGTAGNWIQVTLTVNIPVGTYQKLEYSIHTSGNNVTNVAIDDICLVEPAAAILPVTLLPLQAAYNEGVSHLSWATTQEINSNYFEIEHSSNGTDFTAIGRVYGSGYSSRTINYQFDDVKAGAGVNYYRLRMVDKDGSFAYSNITVVNVTVKGFFVTGVYPSPFNDRVNISISSENTGKAFIRLSDLSGRQVTVQTVTINKGVTAIGLDNLGNLGKGMYLVEVKFNGNSYTQKIMK